MQISAEIWALRDKVLRDDPNESSAVYLSTTDNKHAVCGTDFLPMRWFFFVEETFDHVPSKEKDQVSRCSFQNIKVKQICADFFL